MKLKNFLEGIDILRTYYNDPDGYHIGAEHDEFYMYATDRPLTEDHLKKLLALGWLQPDGGASEDAPQDYDHEGGWMAFT